MDPRAVLIAAAIGLAVYGGTVVVHGVKHVGAKLVHVLKHSKK